MSNKWEYDGSIHVWPMKSDDLWACEYGKLMVNDIYNGLPNFMLDADCVFCDPPYNLGQENSYRTKAKEATKSNSCAGFLDALFAGIDQISPSACFIEIGKQNLCEIETRISKRFDYVDVYDSTYYRRQTCYIVRGGKFKASQDYSGYDEEEVIGRICAQEPFNVIADPCMGRGLLAVKAFEHKRNFVGTELNPARLAVAVNNIYKKGGVWQVDGALRNPLEAVK